MAVEGQPPNKKKRVSVCVGCGSQILDQYIMRVAPDLEWHATCLRCADCSQFLDESCTCFVRDGKTYCKRDYFRVLTPGEEFALREDGNLYCKFDNDNRDRDSGTPCPEMGGSPGSALSSGSAGNNNNNNNVTTPNNNSSSVSNSNSSSNGAKEGKEAEGKRTSSVCVCVCVFYH
nr:hypothetical protein BaRGS_030013 [Batillaria attramentaria]